MIYPKSSLFVDLTQTRHSILKAKDFYELPNAYENWRLISLGMRVKAIRRGARTFFY